MQTPPTGHLTTPSADALAHAAEIPHCQLCGSGKRTLLVIVTGVMLAVNNGAGSHVQCTRNRMNSHPEETLPGVWQRLCAG